MEVILLERIEKLGSIGDVVTVKNGFARNYLLPNNKALRSNERNRALFENNRAKIESDNAERRTAAQGRAGDVDGKQVVLIRQASNTGQLYGSVSVRDIVDALSAEGVANITKTMIELDKPIKALGLVDVKVRLHPEVVVMVGVNVARSPEEADLQNRASTSSRRCSRKTRPKPPQRPWNPTAKTTSKRKAKPPPPRTKPKPDCFGIWFGNKENPGLETTRGFLRAPAKPAWPNR